MKASRSHWRLVFFCLVACAVTRATAVTDCVRRFREVLNGPSEEAYLFGLERLGADPAVLEVARAQLMNPARNSMTPNRISPARHRLLGILTEVHPTEPTPVARELLELAKDSDPVVRMIALNLLRRSGVPKTLAAEALPVLTELAKDSDLQARAAAAWLLGDLPGQGMEILRQLENDGERLVRNNTARAYARLPAAEGLPHLRRMWDRHEDFSTRRYILVEAMRSGYDYAPFIEAFERGGRDEKREAANVRLADRFRRSTAPLDLFVAEIAHADDSKLNDLVNALALTDHDVGHLIDQAKALGRRDLQQPLARFADWYRIDAGLRGQRQSEYVTRHPVLPLDSAPRLAEVRGKIQAAVDEINKKFGAGSIVGVALAGSAGLGYWRPGSDVDFSTYYRDLKAYEAFVALAREKLGSQTPVDLFSVAYQVQPDFNFAEANHHGRMRLFCGDFVGAPADLGKLQKAAAERSTDADWQAIQRETYNFLTNPDSEMRRTGRMGVPADRSRDVSLVTALAFIPPERSTFLRPPSNTSPANPRSAPGP